MLLYRNYTDKVVGGAVIGRVVNKQLPVSLFLLKVRRHCVIINCVYVSPVIRSGSSRR